MPKVQLKPMRNNNNNDDDGERDNGFGFWNTLTNFRFLIGIFILALFIIQKCSG